MFEKLFTKKEHKKTPDKEPVEDLTGLLKLSPRWQKKVLESLSLERALHGLEDGKFNEEYYELEREAVQKAKGLEAREFGLKRAILDGLEKLTPDIKFLAGSIIFAGALGTFLISTDFWGTQKGTEAFKVEKPKPAVIIDVEKDPRYKETALRIRASCPVKARPDLLPKPEEKFNTGIERIDGFKIPSRYLVDVLLETVPRAALSNVDTVSYDPTCYEMSEDYGIEGKEVAHVETSEANIVFTGGSDASSEDMVINDTLLHEIGHLNDWLSNRFLFAEEKVELLNKIANRLEDPGRYVSNYVEAINNEDKRVEAKKKAGEYFAEIFAAYLSDNHDKLPEKDKDIVRSLLKRLDPKFDRVAALKRRKEIVALVKATPGRTGTVDYLDETKF